MNFEHLACAIAILGAVGCGADSSLLTTDASAPPLCGARLSIHGQLEDAQDRPAECGHLGMEQCSPKDCWPFGTWRFSAQTTDGTNSCPDSPPLETEYLIRV